MTNSFACSVWHAYTLSGSESKIITTIIIITNAAGSKEPDNLMRNETQPLCCWDQAAKT
jgi:pectin methylesterase-like acyl-CoA thioesterase